MKIAALTFAIFAIPAAASAACYGTSQFQSCSDSSGNNYSVSRFGNTTMMNGSNARTGSNWSQTSQSIGNSTFHNGRDSNGDSWSTVCGPYGCN